MIGPKVQVLNSCGPRLVDCFFFKELQQVYHYFNSERSRNVGELFLLLSFDFMASVFGISPLRVGRSFCRDGSYREHRDYNCDQHASG